MINSKFNFYAYVIFILPLVLSAALVLLIVGEIGEYIPKFTFIFFLLFYLFGITSSILTAKNETVKITIEEEFIVRIGFLGYGEKVSYSYNELTGFKLMSVPGRTGRTECMYLMIGNNRAVVISELYHKNYDEIKLAIINKNIKDLGVDRFNYLKEFKRIFT